MIRAARAVPEGGVPGRGGEVRQFGNGEVRLGDSILTVAGTAGRYSALPYIPSLRTPLPVGSGSGN